MTHRLVALASAAGLLLAASTLPTAAAAAEPEARYVVVLEEAVADPGSTAADQERRHGSDSATVYRNLKSYTAQMTGSEADRLAADPAVVAVQPDRVVASTVQPVLEITRCVDGADPAVQCLTPPVDRIDGDLSSARSGDGEGSVDVNVAVIDSGVDATHPDLNVAGGVDCSSGTPAPPVGDPVGHGTLVAGVIGARDDGVGVVGVAPGTPIWGVSVAGGDGQIHLSGVLCAVEWVLGTRLDPDPANDIAVANLSLGGPVPGGADDGQCGLRDDDAFHAAICRAVAGGTTFVASAGNDAADLSAYSPAAYDEVLAVTAMADFDGRPGGGGGEDCFGEDLAAFGVADDAAAPFSNYATTVEDALHTVAASGVCVESTFPGGQYAAASGTSFSAPAVTGTVALCIASERCPASTPLVTMATVAADAAVHTTEVSDYGYRGDPLSPADGYYGFLVRAGSY